MENKIQLFEGVNVRYAWDEESEDWLFSAVDVCNVLAESASKDPGAYWRKLKQRLTKEGSEVVTNCHGLKLIASDGKKYLTDCFTTKRYRAANRSHDNLRTECIRQTGTGDKTRRTVICHRLRTELT